MSANKNTQNAAKQVAAKKTAEVKAAVDEAVKTIGHVTKVYRSNNLPKGLRKSVLSIDSVVIVNAGVRNAAISTISEPRIEKIKSKASSLLSEAEGHLAPFLTATSGSYTGHNEQVIGLENSRAYARKRNLVADEPWAHSTRFDLVDLLQYRQRLYIDDFQIVRSFNDVMLQKALRQAIPSLSFINLYGGRHIVFTSGLDKNNVKSFLASFTSVFGSPLESLEVEDYDTRLVHGSIDWEQRNAASVYDDQVVYDGGNDHDGGVCSTYALKCFMVEGCEIIFINLPTVATNISYEALASCVNYIEKDSTIADIINVENGEFLTNDWKYAFRQQLDLILAAPYGDSGIDSLADRFKLSSVGDITPFIARLQQEAFVFHAQSIPSLMTAAFFNFDGLPGVVRDVFSIHTFKMDFANLFKCVNHFSEFEAPFLTGKWAEEDSKKKSGCCAGCDGDNLIIPCREYRYLSALQHSINGKIVQMWDGYDSGASLLRTILIFNLSPAPMQFIASIRAELLRIAHRNIVDMYTKGFYQRNGTVIHAMNHIYSSQITDVSLFTDLQPEGAHMEWDGAYALISDNTNQSKITISLLRGNDYVIERYYAEFFGKIGIMSKSLANVILPG